MQGLQIKEFTMQNYNWLLTKDLSTSSHACQHLSALQWQRLSHNFANWLQKECYLPGVSLCVLVISLLNSVVVEKVGELHELGFPAFQLVLVTKRKLFVMQIDCPCFPNKLTLCITKLMCEPQCISITKINTCFSSSSSFD